MTADFGHWILREFNHPTVEIPLTDDPENGLLRRGDPPQILTTLDPWPATVDGQLRRPPDDHLLASMVEAFILEAGCETGPVEVQLSVMYHPTVSTITYASRLPRCNLCGLPTRYDAKMVTHPRGCWACLCPACYLQHGDGLLGYYHGRYVVTKCELSADLKARFVRAKEHWKQHGVKVVDHHFWE